MVIVYQLARLANSLKSKLVKSMKGKKRYNKVDKTESMRVEIRSRRARKLVAKNLVIADDLVHKSYTF